MNAGDVVATMTLDDPSQVRKAVPYDGDLPAMKPPRSPERKLHHILRFAAQKKVEYVVYMWLVCVGEMGSIWC